MSKISIDHRSGSALPPPSARSRLVAAMMSRTMRPLTDALSLHGLQLWVLRTLALGAGGGLSLLPRGARSTPIRLGTVPCLRVRAQSVAPGAATVLYLHGGGYVFGSPRTHRKLALRLSAASGTEVVLPDYRLAPEHPFPAAAEDAYAAYRALLDEGTAAERIVLAGDSAGAHLACTLLGDITRDGLPMPAAALLWSPPLDWTGATAAERDRIARDPLVSPRAGARCSLAYIGTDAADPRLAVLDGNLSGWPPVLIQAGGTECLLTDAEHLAESLAAAGVPCEMQVWPGQVHVFQALAALVPEARAAIDYAGRFISDQLRRSHRAAS